MRLVQVTKCDRRTAGHFDRPPVFPVKNYRDLGLNTSIQKRISKLVKLSAELSAFAEYAGMLVADMLDDGSVVFLAGADRPAQLEEQNGIRTAGHRLIAP
ncbi:hypothetical protein D3C78_1345660 [compost metagenome]